MLVALFSYTLYSKIFVSSILS